MFEEPIPDAKTAFLAVHTGDVEAGGMKLKEAQLGVFGRGDAIRIKAGPEGARLMLAAGKPIGEPIVWGGPS